MALLKAGFMSGGLRPLVACMFTESVFKSYPPCVLYNSLHTFLCKHRIPNRTRLTYTVCIKAPSKKRLDTDLDVIEKHVCYLYLKCLVLYFAIIFSQ